MSLWEMFSKGGVVMYFLAICSVISLMIILERIWRFWKGKAENPQVTKRVEALLKGKSLKEALRLAEDKRGPMTDVMAAGIRQFEIEPDIENIEKAIERTGSKKLQGLEVNLNILNTIGNISPLLGLLGTVTGMVRCFMQIEKLGGRVDVSQLASGIWEAMLTTAFGLTIAIPCLLFYSYFMGKVDQLEIMIKEVSEDLISILSKWGKDGA
ncbi:MAG: MotA/TolQ/ExbB proton channel family protein [Thermodesulfobacteriota bacterium]|nr:MotA/TolQ/ExbB proton channel family protein [Thermodesulfobacteriota bacterium]